MVLDPCTSFGIVPVIFEKNRRSQPARSAREMVTFGRTFAAPVAEIAARARISCIVPGVLIAGLSAAATFDGNGLAHLDSSDLQQSFPPSEQMLTGRNRWLYPPESGGEYAIGLQTAWRDQRAVRMHNEVHLSLPDFGSRSVETLSRWKRTYLLTKLSQLEYRC